MRIEVSFKDRPGGSRGPVADASVTLRDEDGGPLDGVVLGGYAVWRSTKDGGDYYATGPSREWTDKRTGDVKRFNVNAEDQRLRGIVVAEYRKENGIARPAPRPRRTDEGRPEADPSDDVCPF